MKYYYIGKQKYNGEEKYIYCNEEKMKFYATDDMIDFSDAPGNFRYIREKLRASEVTDQNLKNTLIIAYVAKKNSKKNNIIKRKLRRIKMTRKKLAIGAALILIATSPLIYKTTKQILNNKTEKELELSLDENKQFENYDTFGAAISSNMSISNNFKERLFKDFNALVFSDTQMLDKTRDEIAKRLKEYDFYDVTYANYDDALAYILFGKKSTINKCYAISLDRYANQEDDSIACLFGTLNIPMKNDITSDILVYGDDYYIDYLKDFYNVSKKDIKEIITLFEEILNEYDPEHRAALYNKCQSKISKLLTNYYKSKEEINDFDRHILVSDVFNGSYQVYDNIFSYYIKITHSSEEYESYTKYYDHRTHTDMSMYVYEKRLIDLINEKGTNLDYNDPDCRFLLYLYLLCYQDDLYYYNADLFNITSPDELARIIIKDAFSDEYGYVNTNKEFIYTYFTCGKIRARDLLRAISCHNSDTLSVALYVDLLNCLKKENYIDLTEYDEEIERSLRIIKKENEELYNEAIEALNNGTSMFGKLSFYPSYQEYNNNEVKKYIVEQKTPKRP